jgi:transcriptional antiterminator RfaH
MAAASQKPGNSAATMHWYCLQTRPTKEMQAAGFLYTHFGLEVYLPKLKRRRTIRRVWREVISPLFPRYVFCRFDPAIHFRAVRFASDVTNIVSFGDRPAIVSEDLIRELKGWAGDQLDLISADQDFRAGDSVQVVAGPMQGLRATILHAKSDRQRVTVLLSLLESPAQMVIDRSKLAKFG